MIPRRRTLDVTDNERRAQPLDYAVPEFRRVNVRPARIVIALAVGVLVWWLLSVAIAPAVFSFRPGPVGAALSWVIVISVPLLAALWTVRQVLRFRSSQRR